MLIATYSWRPQFFNGQCVGSRHSNTVHHRRLCRLVDLGPHINHFPCDVASWNDFYAGNAHLANG